MNTIHNTNGQHREQRIRERAFALWERAGNPTGHELNFWLDAEHELIGQENLKASVASAVADPVTLLAESKPKKSISDRTASHNAQSRLTKTAIRPVKAETSRSTTKPATTSAKRSGA